MKILNPWASPYVVLPPLQRSARPLLQPPSFACSIVGFSAFSFVFNNWKVALLDWNWEANLAIEEYPSQSDNIFYSQSKNIVKTHQTTSVFLVLIVKCTTTSHDIKHFTRQFLQLLQSHITYSTSMLFYFLSRTRHICKFCSYSHHKLFLSHHSVPSKFKDQRVFSAAWLWSTTKRMSQIIWLLNTSFQYVCHRINYFFTVSFKALCSLLATSLMSWYSMCQYILWDPQADVFCLFQLQTPLGSGTICQIGESVSSFKSDFKTYFYERTSCFYLSFLYFL